MENENAFVTELFEKYHDQLKRYCMRYVRYNARYYPLVDDCIQEAFYKAVLHQNDVMQSPNPYGWLAKCCENYRIVVTFNADGAVHTVTSKAVTF